jgi:hypothetical protein
MEYSDPDLAAGAVFLGGRVRLGGSVDLLAELPYAIFEGIYAEGYWYSQEVSSSMVGNPYLGLEVKLPIDSDARDVPVVLGLSLGASF